MPYCSKCGHETLENSKFCSNCGSPVTNNIVNQNHSWSLTDFLEENPPNSNGVILCPRCLGKGNVDEEDIYRLEQKDFWLPGECKYCEGVGKINIKRLNLNKKLWRIPQQGMVRGVCAGLAHYLDVPVKLVRVVTVLSIFFGLAFITLVAYIVLSFVLDPMPEGELAAEGAPSSSDILNQVDAELAAGEKRLREMERYVTSDTFTLRSRFRQL